MICIKCGKEAEAILDGNSYCKSCGINYFEVKEYHRLYNGIAWGEGTQTVKIFGEEKQLKIYKPRQ